MANLTLKFLKQETIATGTKAFFFEKPQGFTFKAGQYLNWRLINPKETDDEGTRRFFSIAAAPYENFLMIATRMIDTAFKRILDKLMPGEEIEVFGPSGQIYLHEDINIPAVFLTGGIGVTPFRSIILQAAFEKLPQKIFMFYSNRTLEDAPFLNELQNAQTQNPNFKLINTLTELDKLPQNWNGETGYINKEMIAKYLIDLNQPIYYIAGPPAMVEAMEKMLKDAGISEERIKTENFSGY